MDSLTDQILRQENISNRTGTNTGTGTTNTGTTDTGTTNTGTTTTSETGTTTAGETANNGAQPGASATCLLSRPEPTESNNSCWDQCRETQRIQERECQQLFADIEDALAARGCPARLVPLRRQQAGQQACYPNQQMVMSHGAPPAGCASGMCGMR